MNKNVYKVYKDDIGPALVDHINTLANQTLTERGQFLIGFSGGSLCELLCKYLPQINTDFSSWKVFMCDERYVDEDSPDSNYGYYKKNMLPKIPFKINENIFPINTKVPIEQCAKEYADTILKVSKEKPIPVFDLLLLGIGPDGHTCSLFPNHPQLAEREKIITTITNAPKPPPERITMTLPLLNKAKNVFVITTGDKKKEVLEHVFCGTGDHVKYPIELVRASSRSNVWFLDEAAAEPLEKCKQTLDCV